MFFLLDPHQVLLWYQYVSPLLLLIIELLYKLTVGFVEITLSLGVCLRRLFQVLVMRVFIEVVFMGRRQDL
jgi:hypothetical protein